MSVTTWDAELCLKCNICTAACPVAAATDSFLGPKAVGPQAQRFRDLGQPAPNPSVSWCSGCGVCSRVCPHHVPVAELNILAKADAARRKGIPLRDQVLARPALLAQAARPIAPLANRLLHSPFVRGLAETVLGVSRSAPMPRFAERTFRDTHASLIANHPTPHLGRPLVAYFHGCSVDSYEPDLGDLAVRVLIALGFEVVIPPQGCCGLPLQSNGLLDAARGYAQSNLDRLIPFASANVPIIGTSTSCILALKHEYRAILGLNTESADLVAEASWDIFEFLRDAHPEALDHTSLRSVPRRILYHAPCQLQAHGIGWPAHDVMRRIPDLEIVLSESECCGVAGTYGLKRERYPVAREVGAGLFEMAQAGGLDAVVTDSETCRWWMEGHTGLRAVHPLEILGLAMGVREDSAIWPTSNLPGMAA